MIGGADIIIARAVDADGKRAILRVLRANWPDAILEHARSDVAPWSVGAVDAASLPDEILAYKSKAWRESWETEGATPTNADTMIHIVVGPTSLTCVVDERDASETATIAEQLRLELDLVRPPLIHDSFFLGGFDDPGEWIEREVA